MLWLGLGRGPGSCFLSGWQSPSGAVREVSVTVTAGVARQEEQPKSPKQSKTSENHPALPPSPSPSFA